MSDPYKAPLEIPSAAARVLDHGWLNASWRNAETEISAWFA
jgi:hypothetical protein